MFSSFTDETTIDPISTTTPAPVVPGSGGFPNSSINWNKTENDIENSLEQEKENWKKKIINEYGLVTKGCSIPEKGDYVSVFLLDVTQGLVCACVCMCMYVSVATKSNRDCICFIFFV